MRILIADDSIVSRHLLDATLRKWGYEVVVACDGVEAWNALQGENAPRIAILDWVMPGLTGPEVCKRVREHSRDSEGAYTYLLLLSSKSQREDLIEGLDCLEERQWRPIWSSTRGFRFDHDTAAIKVSGNMAWIGITWHSEGKDALGRWYERLGRATYILCRRADRWFAVHTHHSLNPDRGGK